jgi:hypothetical protein
MLFVNHKISLQLIVLFIDFKLSPISLKDAFSAADEFGQKPYWL